MKINEIRLNNLNWVLATKCDGKKVVLSEKIGMRPQGIAKWWSANDRRAIGNKSAEKVEEAFHLPSGWMDTPHNHYHELTTGEQQGHITGNIPVTASCILDSQLKITLLNLNRKGMLMMKSTDPNAYCMDFVGHNSNIILTEGWGIVVEPSTELAINEYALIKLNDGQILLRVIVHIDDGFIIAKNPVEKTQDNIPRTQITSAEYCYIGIPPSKIVETAQK